jgi:hypothetical protein
LEHRRSIVRFTKITLACTLACAIAPSVARADEEPSSSDVAAARSLGQEGVKLAEAGNCHEAVDRLARAEKMYHAPTTLARLGECQVQLGKIVEGTENLNRVVRESLAPGAPAAFATAQERAKKVLADAKPKIAKLKISVTAPPEAQLSVRVDGEAVPTANLNSNRPMDPGDHLVEATAPGYKPAKGRVRLAEGGSDTMALTLEVDPNAVKATPVIASTNAPAGASRGPSPAEAEPHEEGRSRVPAYLVLGFGVAGIGVGTVFGLMASDKKSDLSAACGPEKQCPSSTQSTLDDGKTFGTVSTIGFIAGGVALVTGAFLFFTSGSSSSSASARTTMPSMTPSFGLGGGGVTGRF